MITCYFEDGNKASLGLRHITTSIIVLKDNCVLFGKRGTHNGKPILEHGKWGLPGGFFDRDETLIQAVRREIMEETGWEVESPELFRIVDHPGRPHEDRQNVDFVFIAHATKRLGKNDEEVSELKWFPLDALPPLDQIAFDQGEDLALYKQYLVTPHPLPILGKLDGKSI